MGLANAGMKAAKYQSCVYVKSRWTTFSTSVLSRSFDLVAFTTKWTFYQEGKSICFPTKIGKIKRHFFVKVNDKKDIFQIFAQPHVLIIACSTFLISTIFTSKRSSKNQQSLIVNNFWVSMGPFKRAYKKVGIHSV